MWLNPAPLAEDLGLAYAAYFTHQQDDSVAPAAGSVGPASALRRASRFVRESYLWSRFGYVPQGGATAAHRLAALIAWVMPARREFVETLVMRLRAIPGGRLLDVGCGSGDFLLAMKSLGWEPHGVDFDPEAVRSANRRGLNVELGSLGEHRYPADSFDAVTMIHSIEHVPDPLAVLSEARRVLKSGGQLSIATPNIRSVGHRLFGSNWAHLDPPRHLMLFTPEALSELARQAGFSRAKTVASTHTSGWILVASLSIRRTGRFAAGRAQSRVETILAGTFCRIERGLNWIMPAGEEILLTATK
ncbi:MAG TPA: class I SAM-dependent methyltransferase [Candidatus Binataceae bacterium]|nr:class I SAM-dependent methyltransferase [Candidatus Binataceae bacterium]